MEPHAGSQTRSHWLSLRLQQDFLRFTSADGVCSRDQPARLSCFRAGGEPRAPSLPVAGTGGRIRSGWRAATTRLMLGYRWFQGPRFSLSGTLGWAVRGGPPASPTARPFLPLHAELEALYWFQTPIYRGLPRLRPYAGLGGGLARFDSAVVTDVLDRDPIGGGVRRSSVEVWQRAGPLFVAASSGVSYELSREARLRLGLRLLLAPAGGLGSALQMGYAQGF